MLSDAKESMRNSMSVMCVHGDCLKDRSCGYTLYSSDSAGFNLTPPLHVVAIGLPVIVSLLHMMLQK